MSRAKRSIAAGEGGAAGEGAKVSDRFAALQGAVSSFNRARRWKKFHAPKNLAMALAIEAAELMEPLRWSTPADSWKLARDAQTRAYLLREMADVLLVLTSMADYLDVDLLQAAHEKLALNEQRYPAAQAKGRADKYTAYQVQSSTTVRAKSAAAHAKTQSVSQEKNQAERERVSSPRAAPAPRTRR